MGSSSLKIRKPFEGFNGAGIGLFFLLGLEIAEPLPTPIIRRLEAFDSFVSAILDTLEG